MPAHIKASLLGSGLLIPVGKGQLLLGTWQGIYLGEHREHGGARQVVVTLFGETQRVT
jgi:secondary thiamine-phosphate synthase enzyme